MKASRFELKLAVLAIAAFAALCAFAGAASAVPQRPVCPGPASAGSALCHARVVTDAAGKPKAASAPKGYGPAEFHGAYGLPSSASSAQTIAIVDAFDDPKIANDLNTYSSQFGLPQCNKANPCFEKVNQNGSATGPFPRSDSGWSLEIALDVEVAHAICPSCKILLVEASSNSLGNLAEAVNTAAKLGADEISNSYGGGEYSSEANVTAYDHPGVAVTVSSGDSGYGSFGFPAAAPSVIAVGGTTLNLGTGNTYGSESVWSGSGSGCSLYLTASAWQSFLSACAGKRGVADVAADANPSTGAAVYDSVKYQGRSGWFKVGGTSLSSPLVAGVYALAGGLPSGTTAASGLYGHLGDASMLHDVTSGSNGSCSTIMCKGAVGYDGPTGVGTPKGTGAF
ncbi:MAG: S8 family serine peptidase [Chloroflexota bacterium]